MKTNICSVLNRWWRIAPYLLAVIVYFIGIQFSPRLYRFPGSLGLVSGIVFTALLFWVAGILYRNEGKNSIGWLSIIAAIAWVACFIMLLALPMFYRPTSYGALILSGITIIWAIIDSNSSKQAVTTGRDTYEVIPSSSKKMVEISAYSGGGFAINFPRKCVYCGKPKDTELGITARYKMFYGTGETRYYLGLQIPYCTTHATESRRNDALLSMAFIYGFVLAFYLAFYWILSQSFRRGEEIIALLILIAVSFLGGFLVRVLAKPVLSKFCSSIADTSGFIPWLAVGSALGITTELYPYMRPPSIKFSFTNTEFAREFETLNR